MAGRWASFDVYGTLVDWNGGIRAELSRLWPEADAGELLVRYHEIEPRVQLDGSLPYREILRQALCLLAEAEGLELPREEQGALADSLPSWPPFPEVRDELEEIRRRGFAIALLSNTDPDLLAASIDEIGIDVDATVTGRDAGSYKPAHGHWLTFFEREDVDRARHVHVAASLFHDVAPCAELGVPVIWINREGEASGLERTGELPTLAGLAELLETIAPR